MLLCTSVAGCVYGEGEYVEVIGGFTHSKEECVRVISGVIEV